MFDPKAPFGESQESPRNGRQTCFANGRSRALSRRCNVPIPARMRHGGRLTTVEEASSSIFAAIAPVTGPIASNAARSGPLPVRAASVCDLRSRVARRSPARIPGAPPGSAVGLGRPAQAAAGPGLGVEAQVPDRRAAAAGSYAPQRASPESAAAAIRGRSISKWARSASRVSLRPKPSVPERQVRRRHPGRHEVRQGLDPVRRHDHGAAVLHPAPAPRTAPGPAGPG